MKGLGEDGSWRRLVEDWGIFSLIADCYFHSDTKINQGVSLRWLYEKGNRNDHFEQD